jgi:cell division FtsZ-interacting protein ZapD
MVMGVLLGMSKERSTFSLDPEVNEFLQQDHVNASGLVNKLVKQHMNGGADEDILREFRIQQLESELNQIESQQEQKRKELEKLRQIDQNKSEEQQQQLEEARDELAETPKDPENPAIQNWAEKLGLTAAELIDELEGDNE